MTDIANDPRLRTVHILTFPLTNEVAIQFAVSSFNEPEWSIKFPDGTGSGISSEDARALLATVDMVGTRYEACEEWET